MTLSISNIVRLQIGPTTVANNSEILITAIGRGGADSSALACFTDLLLLLVVMERIVQLLLVSLVMMQTGYSLMGLLFQLVQVQQQLVQLPQLIAITLHRGDNSFSPTGKYCCVKPPDATYNAIVTSL